MSIDRNTVLGAGRFEEFMPEIVKLRSFTSHKVGARAEAWIKDIAKSQYGTTNINMAMASESNEPFEHKDSQSLSKLSLN
jgi:hypothetical protein